MWGEKNCSLSSVKPSGRKEVGLILAVFSKEGGQAWCKASLAQLLWDMQRSLRSLPKDLHGSPSKAPTPTPQRDLLQHILWLCF